jgi:hypothetical protein
MQPARNLLRAGQLLTITAGVGSTGSVRRLAQPGETTQYTVTAIAASSTTRVGPFADDRQYEILSTAGELTYTIALTDPTSSSEGLAQALSDESGTGAAVFNVAPTLHQPVIHAPVSELDDDGAITISPGLHKITKAGVAALSLAAPSVAQEGDILEIVSRSAHAHTINAEIAATASIGAGANGTVIITASTPGVDGNDFTVEVILGAASGNLEADITDGAITVTLGMNSGTAQVETATVLGTIGPAGAGNATVIVTAAGMTGSPITTPVAVANDDTASDVAGKIRVALALVANIDAYFTVSGASAAVILTRKAAAANDATLNISVDNGTCTGLTAALTSANTTAGVAHAVDNAKNTATLVASAVDGLTGVAAVASGSGVTALTAAEGPTDFEGGVSYEALIHDGIVGGAKKTVTLAAYPGASLRLAALDELWHVLALNAATVS